MTFTSPSVHLIVCGFSCFLATASPAWAQATGAITGIVTDEQGGALPAAAVVAIHAPTGSRRETTTQRDGRYVLTDLRSGGPYSLTVTMPGFRSQEQHDVIVSGGEQRSIDFRLPIAALSEEVTVTGGTEMARLQKQAADHIVDVVSADSLGRFPDNNAAEALRRIPGVSMEIDQGEGRFVVVRGIDASLNNVTINGQIVGTPAEFGTRGVSMDSVPADLISRLEVTKAVRPDMDANAIGASINISTLSAFDRPAGLFSGSLRTGYNDMGDARPTAAASRSATCSTPAGAGVLLSGEATHTGVTTPSCIASRTVLDEPDGFLVPQNNAFFLYDVERQRQGVNASLSSGRNRGGRCSCGSITISLRTRKGDSKRSTTSREARSPTRRPRPASSARAVPRGSIAITPRNISSTRSCWAGSTTSRAPRSMEGSAAAAVSGGPPTAWTGSSGRPRMPFRARMTCLTPPVPSSRRVRASTRQMRIPSAASASATTWSARTCGPVRRTCVAHSGCDRSAYWKAGAKAITRDKYQNRENHNYLGSTFTLADFGLGAAGPDDFLEGSFRFGPTLNLPALRRSSVDNPSRFNVQTRDQHAESLEQDFEAGEDVFAGLSDGWRRLRQAGTSLIGARVENTRAGRGRSGRPAVVRGWRVYAAARIPRRGTTNYTDVLPGVHVNAWPKQNDYAALRMDQHDWQAELRASWRRFAVLDDIQNEDGTFTGSLSSGNPDSRAVPFDERGRVVRVRHEETASSRWRPFTSASATRFTPRSFVETGTVLNGRSVRPVRIQRGPRTPTSGADYGHRAGVFKRCCSMLPSPIRWIRRQSELHVHRFVGHGLRTRAGRSPVLRVSPTAWGMLRSSISRSTASRRRCLRHTRAPHWAASDRHPRRRQLRPTATCPSTQSSATRSAATFKPFFELRNLNREPRRRYAGSPERRVAHEIYSWTLYAGIDWSR